MIKGETNFKKGDIVVPKTSGIYNDDCIDEWCHPTREQWRLMEAGIEVLDEGTCPIIDDDGIEWQIQDLHFGEKVPYMIPGYLFELKNPPAPTTIIDMTLINEYLDEIPDITVDELKELEKFIRSERGPKLHELDEFNSLIFDGM